MRLTLRKLNQRNQITLPQSVVKKMGVHDGDFLYVYAEKERIILKPVAITEKDEAFSPDEWEKLEAHVARQTKYNEYTEYTNLADAKSHLTKRMKKK